MAGGKSGIWSKNFPSRPLKVSRESAPLTDLGTQFQSLLIKLDIRGRGRTFHFTSDFVNYPPCTSGITIDLFKEMYVINFTKTKTYGRELTALDII